MRVCLWLVYKFTDFSPSSLKLKRGILPFLTKYEKYLSYQAKIFLVNLTPKELTPCKISHICNCTLISKVQFFYGKL